MKVDIENEIVKFVKVCLKASTQDCYHCKGSGFEREMLLDDRGIAKLDGTEFQWVDSDTPCPTCKGSKIFMPNWHDAGCQLAVISFCMSAARRELARQNTHGAEMYLSCALEWQMKAIEAAGGIDLEKLGSMMRDLQDEFSR